MKPLVLAVALAAAVHALPGRAVAAAGQAPSSNVAWLAAAADADVDRAFTQARAQRKPLLLYWGATWCPPCNQLKATLFNRQEFAELARSLVAVNVDGDRPGAQKLAQRFHVSGYPTLVLFSPQGQEVTRLPGEVDAPQVLAMLQQGLAGGRPAPAVLRDAMAGKPLAAGEWRLLAFYSWDTDEQQLVPKAQLAPTLSRLAAAAAPVDADAAARLWLKSLVAADEAANAGDAGHADAGARERLMLLLAEPARSRALMDVLSNGAVEIVRAVDPPPGGAERAPLVAAFDTALQRLERDATLSRADRLGALYGRVELARLGLPKDAVQVTLPAPLLADVREQAARLDRETTDAYERQAVIPNVADTLAKAGLWAESDALLKANLARSHAPYYLMSQLGHNARQLGRRDEALGWYAQAFEKSEGPATRLQWGAGYLAALVALAPQDAARIEATAARLFDEAARDPGAFEGRSQRALRRIGSQLASWDAADTRARAPVLKRLQPRLDAVCARVDAAGGRRAACRGLLATPAAVAAKKTA